MKLYNNVTTMRLPLVITVAAVAASVLQVSEAGTTDHRYKKDEHIELWVNKVSFLNVHYTRSLCVWMCSNVKDLWCFFFAPSSYNLVQYVSYWRSASCDSLIFNTKRHQFIPTVCLTPFNAINQYIFLLLFYVDRWFKIKNETSIIIKLIKFDIANMKIKQTKKQTIFEFTLRYNTLHYIKLQ